MGSNNAFERPVTRFTSARCQRAIHLAPPARLRARRAPAQRERLPSPMKRYLYTALTAAIVLAVLTFSGATVVDALVRMGHGLGPTEEGCGVPGWDLRMAAIFGSYSVLMSATLLTPLAFLSRDLFAMKIGRAH